MKSEDFIRVEPKLEDLAFEKNITRADYFQRTTKPQGVDMGAAAKMAPAVAPIVPFEGLGGWTREDPLMPTGDSVKDTAHLRAAIHDPRMDAGGTLYLGKGTFLINGSIVRQRFDPTQDGYNPEPFNGTIQGEGRNKTTLKAVRGPNDEPFTPVHDILFDAHYGAMFWLTEEEYVGVRDLTFKAEPGIAEKWQTDWGESTGLMNFVNMGSGSRWQGETAGAHFENVDFKGSVNVETGMPEMPYLVMLFGGAGGTHTLKSCRFQHAFGPMYYNFGLRDGAINVEDVKFINREPTSGNATSLWFTVFSNCTLNIKNNKMEQAGMYAIIPANSEPSNAFITENKIGQGPNSLPSAGITIFDRNRVDFNISGNELTCPDWYALYASNVNFDAQSILTNNAVTGEVIVE